MIEIDCRKCIRCNGKECFAYHTDKPDVATKKCANDNFKNYITKENATVEFNGFTQGVIGKKLYADSVLKKMQKSELIELLHLAQHNYNTLMRFYTNAVNANMDKWKEQEEHDKEIRNKAIEEFAEEIKSTLPIAVHRDCSEVDYEVDYALYSLRHRIDRIAEQLKGEAI